MGNHSESESTQAVVVATYSREMNLRLAKGEIVRAKIKGKKYGVNIRKLCNAFGQTANNKSNNWSYLCQYDKKI